MWERIRIWYGTIGGNQGGLEKVAENPLGGIVFMVAFVKLLEPPGSSILKSCFIVVVGMLAIHGIATLMRNSPAYPAEKEDCEDSTVN